MGLELIWNNFKYFGSSSLNGSFKFSWVLWRGPHLDFDASFIYIYFWCSFFSFAKFYKFTFCSILHFIERRHVSAKFLNIVQIRQNNAKQDTFFKRVIVLNIYNEGAPNSINSRASSGLNPALILRHSFLVKYIRRMKPKHFK